MKGSRPAGNDPDSVSDDTDVPKDVFEDPQENSLEDIHIAGVLVHCRSLDLTRIRSAVDALDGAEVFQSSVQGKLVVVVEAPSSNRVLEVLNAIRALAGVLNVSLVYQHAEPASSMQQELGP